MENCFICFVNFTMSLRLGEDAMLNKPDKNDSYIDDLTSTYTMEYLENQLISKASEGPGYASLALIDVSWIKEINDSLDYSTGNAVLKLFIHKLKDSLQESGVIYRLSGLEFAILLLGQSPEQCVEKLQNIKRDIGILKIQHRDTEIPLNPNFYLGIVMFEFKESFSLASLLEQAREALSMCRSNDQEIVVYQASPRKKKKLLLVEDTDFIIHYIKSKLITMNLEVLIAKDGEDGVRQGQIERPDLIIVDLMLPKMDGFEVCRQIKANPKTKDTKIIIMSARKSKDDVLRCFKLGIDDYLVKPFGLDDFEQRIKRLLK